MLNEGRGVLDDLIVYFMTESWFRLLVHGAAGIAILVWIRAQQRNFNVEGHRAGRISPFGIQGPEARAKTVSLLSASAADAAMALGPFFGREIDGWFVHVRAIRVEDGLK